MTHKEQARKLYQQMTPARESWEQMGMTPQGAMAATVEEIEAHLSLVAEVAAEYEIRLDADKVAFGAGREEIEAKASSRRKRNRRGAGARALVRKYGKAGAQDIIYRNTGRRYNLRD